MHEFVSLVAKGAVGEDAFFDWFRENGRETIECPECERIWIAMSPGTNGLISYNPETPESDYKPEFTFDP
ncbi:MAG: hypothetical protein K1X35_00595 [Caulobacteraceae bacterium]|nr:hypothetical protein [Caulobacteraceae bacterium]